MLKILLKILTRQLGNYYFIKNLANLFNLIKTFIAVLFVTGITAGCNNNSDKIPEETTPVVPAVATINFAVKASYPHDTSLFTEGFLFHDGKLFESTGSPEDLPQVKSMVGITNLQTGKFEQKVSLEKKYFGEGIVFLNNKLYELTYKNQLGFIYDAKSFKKLDSFTYKNIEGWSLTTDGKEIIMDDGTDIITFLDPVTLKPVKTLKVTEAGLARDSLNELEFINGFIYANIWLSNYIVKIDTATGKVVGKLDLSSLVYEAKNKNPRADVLNGIAYDSVTNKIYVTGKLWPNIYEIEFAH